MISLSLKKDWARDREGGEALGGMKQEVWLKT